MRRGLIAGLIALASLAVALWMVPPSVAAKDRHMPKLTLDEYLKLDRTNKHRCKPPGDILALEAKDTSAVHLATYFQPLWPMAAGQTIPESGYLVYEVLINDNGVPNCFELLETNFRHWEFQDATEKAIRKWRYDAPTDHEGNRVWCYTYVIVKY